MRHRGHRASDKRDNLALQANGRAAPCALIWHGTVERHCIGAWGCRSFCFPISPRSYEIRLPCLADDRHGCLGTGQESRRGDFAGFACSEAIGNYRLICSDIIPSHMQPQLSAINKAPFSSFQRRMPDRRQREDVRILATSSLNRTTAMGQKLRLAKRKPWTPRRLSKLVAELDKLKQQVRTAEATNSKTSPSRLAR